MSILSDGQIKSHIRSDKGIDIKDHGDFEKQLQPSSFDIRVGETFTRVRADTERRTPVGDPVVDPFEDDLCVEYERFRVDDHYVVEPGEFLLGTTIERVKLPDNIAAKVEGRSSFGRLGLIIHATAGFADAGFEGQITLEISNLSNFAIKLRPSTRVGQLVFHQLEDTCEVPYGEKRDAKYQGQIGPVGSRINEDS